MLNRNQNSEQREMRVRIWVPLAIVTAGLLLGSCDTNVVNPGRVDDTKLNERGAQTAMVTGAGRALSFGLNWLAYTSAAVSREVHPSGSTGSFGISAKWQNGLLEQTDNDLDDHWEQSQRARWVAEEVIRRMDADGPLSNLLLQQALVWVGYSNRVLGDNMCNAVIDGGSLQHDSVYFFRAEAAFTRALGVQAGTSAAAVANQTAAYAGRAQARAFLATWYPSKLAEAEADAANVAIGFVYNLTYFNVGDDDQRNRIAWATANSPYRAHTQWNTWYADYRNTTNDPRISFRVSARDSTGDAAIECCGRVLWWPQTKHPNSQAPIRLTSGREMRLIVAEALLIRNDVLGAMNAINAVRTNAGAPLLSVTPLPSATEAWRLLKRERGIELWLEGRRLGDLRRWSILQRPGALDPLEQPGAGSHLQRQDLCFPVPPTERETNPNLQG